MALVKKNYFILLWDKLPLSFAGVETKVQMTHMTNF